MKGIILMLAVLQMFQCQLIDPSTYSLGSNLIQNSNFELPYLVSFYVYFTTIPGWTCSPQCDILNTTQVCINQAKPCTLNWIQALDLCSSMNFDNVSQAIFISTAGKYLLRFDWLLPLQNINATGQGFTMSINGTAVVTIIMTADQSANWTYHEKQVILELPTGNSTLSIMQFGTIMDLGFSVANVRLNQLFPIEGGEGEKGSTFNILMNELVGNNVTSSLNSLPGSRVYFSAVLGFLSAFDRLQFYYYHRQNLTYYSEKLLSTVNTMALERGSLLQNLVQDCDNSLCATINNAYENMLGSLDRQKDYTSSDFLRKNENGIGFFANNLEFFFFELPGIIVVYVAFALLFRLLFNFRVSRLIRKYSLWGVIIFIIFEGNVEQFAFYFFAECRLLYSATAAHKLGRSFMLLFFFALLVSSVCGLTLSLVHYRKLAKYLMEDCRKVSLLAILLESLEKSVFPLIFGCVHALLLQNLFVQTITIGVVEAVYFSVKLVTLSSGTAKYHFKVVMLSLTSLLRLVLIATFYLYESDGNPHIINLIHHDIVWLYIICWGVETLYDISRFTGDVIVIFKKSCSKGKQAQKGRHKRVEARKNRAIQQDKVTRKKLKSERKQGKSSEGKEKKASSEKEKTSSKQKGEKSKKKEVREKQSLKKQKVFQEKNRLKSASEKKSGITSKDKKRENINSAPKGNNDVNRVVTVKQNGFNINVTFMENDIRFQFEDPSRISRQKSSKKGKEKKKKTLHDEKQN